MAARLFTMSRLLTERFLDRCNLALVNFWNRYMGHLEDAVAMEVEKLKKLPNPKNPDMQRIAPAIYDAAMCYHSFHWRPIFMKTLHRYYQPIERNPRRKAVPWTRPPMAEPWNLPSVGDVVMAAVVIVCLVVGFGFILWILIVVLASALAMPSLSGLTVGGFVVSLFVLLVLLFAWMVLRSLLPYTRRAAALVLALLVTVTAVRTFSLWGPKANEVWRSLLSSVPATVRISLSSFQPAESLVMAAWLAAIICTVILFVLAIRYLGVLITNGREFPGYGAWAEQCAALILGFLDVSCSLTKACVELSSATPAGAKEVGEMLPKAGTQQQIDFQLNQLRLHCAWTMEGCHAFWSRRPKQDRQ